MFQILYGSTAAGLYDQAAKLNAQARTLYLQSSDTYYKANDGAPLPPSRYFRRRFRLPVASAICMRGRCAIFTGGITCSSAAPAWPSPCVVPTRSETRG